MNFVSFVWMYGSHLFVSLLTEKLYSLFTDINSAFDFCNKTGFTGKWLIMSVSEFAYTYLENGQCTCSTR